jgi:SOS-response transcriptional repressor LexA
MSTLAERVAECMAETGNTPASVAAYCGIRAPSVYNWIDGKTKNLTGMNLIRASVLFGVSPEWLQSGKPPKYTSKQGDYPSFNQASPNPENAPVIEPSSTLNVRYAPPQRTAVPVISAIQAGRMKEIGYVPELGAGDRFESPEHKLGARGWAMVVEGDSMDDGTDKGIPAGWLIFVDPDIAPTPNSYVIAKDVATQAATFKKLVYDAGRWYLRPLNRQYQAIEIDSPELRVIGVVTEARPPSRKLA